MAKCKSPSKVDKPGGPHHWPAQSPDMSATSFCGGAKEEVLQEEAKISSLFRTAIRNV